MTRTSRRGYRTSYTVAAAQGAVGTGSGGGGRPGARRQRHGHPEQCSPQTSLPGSRTEGASDSEAGRRPGRPPCKDLRHQVTPRLQRWRGSHPSRRAHTQKPAASPCSHRHQARLSPPVPLSPTSAALDPPPARPCSSSRYQVSFSFSIASRVPDRLWQQPSLLCFSHLL